jgi:hypothetical protein
VASFWDLHDRALRILEDRFGEAVLWYPDPAAAGIAGTAIFDETPARTDLGTVVGLYDQSPWCGVRLLDLPAGYTPNQGDRVGFRGTDWEIASLLYDGGGHCRMQLFRMGPGTTGPLPPLAVPAPLLLAKAG